MKLKPQKIKIDVPCPHKSVQYSINNSSKRRVKPFQCFEEAVGDTCGVLNDLNCILFNFIREVNHKRPSPVTVPSTAQVCQGYKHDNANSGEPEENYIQSIKIDIAQDNEKSSQISEQKTTNERASNVRQSNELAKSPKKDIQSLNPDDPLFSFKFDMPSRPMRVYYILGQQICFVLSKLRLKKYQLQVVSKYFNTQTQEQSELLQYLIQIFEVPEHILQIYEEDCDASLSYEFLLLLLKKLKIVLNYQRHSIFE